MSLTLASQTIGFISFSITLLTLLGVYSELIKTLRGAATTIPLALGNLREELQWEQLYLYQKRKDGDQYDVFPEGRTKARRRQHEFMSLIEQTLRHLWTEFCAIEKEFLVKGETPWTLLRSGQDGELTTELDEKFSFDRRRRSSRSMPRRESYRRNRMGMIEAGLSSDRSTYYRTDISARFNWWFKHDDINNLAEQIQRIQIRRLERDVFEMDAIVKRGYKMQCHKNGWNPRGDTSDDSGGSDHDDGHRRDPSGGPRGPHGHRRHRRSRSDPEGALGHGMRETSEKKVIRRRQRSPERASGAESAYEQRRPERAYDRKRPEPGVYEYEVVNPGRIYVEVDSPRSDHTWHRGRQRSDDRNHQ